MIKNKQPEKKWLITNSCNLKNIHFKDYKGRGIKGLWFHIMRTPQDNYRLFENNQIDWNETDYNYINVNQQLMTKIEKWVDIGKCNFVFNNQIKQKGIRPETSIINCFVTTFNWSEEDIKGYDWKDIKNQNESEFKNTYQKIVNLFAEDFSNAVSDRLKRPRIYAVVHWDEKSPNIHFGLSNVDLENNRVYPGLRSKDLKAFKDWEKEWTLNWIKDNNLEKWFREKTADELKISKKERELLKQKKINIQRVENFKKYIVSSERKKILTELKELENKITEKDELNIAVVTSIVNTQKDAIINLKEELEEKETIIDEAINNTNINLHNLERAAKYNPELLISTAIRDLEENQKQTILNYIVELSLKNTPIAKKLKNNDAFQMLLETEKKINFELTHKNNYSFDNERKQFASIQNALRRLEKKEQEKEEQKKRLEKNYELEH